MPQPARPIVYEVDMSCGPYALLACSDPPPGRGGRGGGGGTEGGAGPPLTPIDFWTWPGPGSRRCPVTEGGRVCLVQHIRARARKCFTKSICHIDFVHYSSGRSRGVIDRESRGGAGEGGGGGLSRSSPTGSATAVTAQGPFRRAVRARPIEQSFHERFFLTLAAPAVPLRYRKGGVGSPSPDGRERDPSRVCARSRPDLPLRPGRRVKAGERAFPIHQTQ